MYLESSTKRLWFGGICQVLHMKTVLLLLPSSREVLKLGVGGVVLVSVCFLSTEYRKVFMPHGFRFNQ